MHSLYFSAPLSADPRGLHHPGSEACTLAASSQWEAVRGWKGKRSENWRELFLLLSPFARTISDYSPRWTSSHNSSSSESARNTTLYIRGWQWLSAGLLPGCYSIHFLLVPFTCHPSVSSCFIKKKKKMPSKFLAKCATYFLPGPRLKTVLNR